MLSQAGVCYQFLFNWTRYLYTSGIQNMLLVILYAYLTSLKGVLKEVLGAVF